jgi:hypothetical protein
MLTPPRFSNMVSSPGLPLSRQELAEAVNAFIRQANEGHQLGAVEANHVGKWERGVICWPTVQHRAALQQRYEQCLVSRPIGSWVSGAQRVVRRRNGTR